MAPKRVRSAPGQPHDGLIRSALESLGNARLAIAAVRPASLLAQLDLTCLRPAPARIVDALLHARESDAMWDPVAGLDVRGFNTFADGLLRNDYGAVAVFSPMGQTKLSDADALGPVSAATLFEPGARLGEVMLRMLQEHGMELDAARLSQLLGDPAIRTGEAVIPVTPDGGVVEGDAGVVRDAGGGPSDGGGCPRRRGRRVRDARFSRASRLAARAHGGRCC